MNLASTVDAVAGVVARLTGKVTVLEQSAHAHRWAVHDSTGVVMGTNWTLVSFAASRSERMLVVSITAERTTSSISYGTNGNVSNSTVATLPAGLRGSATPGAQPLTSLTTGRVAAGVITVATGVIQLTAVGGTTDVTVGEQISLGGVVLLNS